MQLRATMPAVDICAARSCRSAPVAGRRCGTRAAQAAARCERSWD